VRGDIRVAQADCEAAVAPEDPGVIEKRGLLALKWNQPDKALTDFNHALSLRQGMPWALFGRGRHPSL